MKQRCFTVILLTLLLAPLAQGAAPESASTTLSNEAEAVCVPLIIDDVARRVCGADVLAPIAAIFARVDWSLEHRIQAL
jgi:hypothetical protein